MTHFDFIVAGAGVAGAAAALKILDAGFRVGVLGRPSMATAVESLSPAAARSLISLSITPGEPLTKVVAWWGSDQARNTEYEGAYVVERYELIQNLRSRAVDAGAIFIEFEKITAVRRRLVKGNLEFEVVLGASRTVSARYLVDATGHASAVGRKLGAHRCTSNQLFCLSTPVEHKVGRAGTWTESVEDGWWNLSCTREIGTLSFFSDASTIRDAGRNIVDRFLGTRELCHLVIGPISVNWTAKPCGSSRLTPGSGEGWIAVGDASTVVQPLASAGIAKALRDAQLVSTAVQNPDAYDRLQAAEYQLYLVQLRNQYKLETRWPQSVFWSHFQRSNSTRSPPTI